jgi:surfeit locus 1 family protein
VRSRVLWLVPTLAFCALTSWACSWQLSRAHAKLAYEAEVKERSALPPLTGAGIARDAADGALQSQRHVDVEGQWDAAHTVLLMNRTMGERPGFYVMTPLRLADGGAVLVQRGWVAGVDGDPGKAPPVTTPAGPVALHGHVAPWPSHWFDLGHGTGGAVRQNVELAPFSAESGLALRPVIVVEDANAGNASDGLGRDWPAPTAGVSIATHYGYAAQWAAMAVVSLGLYVWLQFLRPRKRASTDSDSPLDARVDDRSS